MRNKKSFLSLGLFVLILFLGVGYAVVSSVYFKAKGTASVNDSELNVEITDAVATSSINGKIVDFNHVLSNKNLTSNFTLNEMELNEMVTITYTVTNNENDVDSVLSTVNNGVFLTSSNSDYFKVFYSITDSLTDIENGDKTMTVDVYVELIKTPVVAENGSTTVELTLTAIPSKTASNLEADSTYDVTPLRFGEKYYYVTFVGVDIKKREWWISFNEDGTLDHPEGGASLTETDGYYYTKTNIFNSKYDYELLISSDGVFITNMDVYGDFASNNVISYYVLESEFNYLKTLPIAFAEKYICTTDNSENSNSSYLGNHLTFFPDGSMVVGFNDGEITRYAANTVSFTSEEIKSNELPEGYKLLVSSDGKTITQIYNDQVLYVYTNQYEIS